MKGILFDLDGTLLDTLADLADACNFALQKNQLPVRSLSDIRRFVGNGVRSLVKKALPESGEGDFDSVFADFDAYYVRHSQDKTRPYPGILPLLERLKNEGFPIGIVSNKPDGAVKKLAAHWFPGLCDAAIGEREGVPKKPDPASVFACVRALAVPIEDCLYIGDSEVDLATAKNAGIPCISVTWGFRDQGELAALGQTAFAADCDELFRMIRSYNGGLSNDFG